MNQKFKIIFSIALAAGAIFFLPLGKAAAAPLGAGEPSNNSIVTDGAVNAMTKVGSNVYLGGYFTYAGQRTGAGVIANAADGSSQPSFPFIDNGEVRAVVSDGNNGWYVGGQFAITQDSVTYKNLIHVLSTGNLDTNFNLSFVDATHEVYALALSGTTLYVGGKFTSIGGAGRGNLAAVDTTSSTVTLWDPEVNAYGTVYALLVQGSTIYVGGDFYSIGGQSRSYLAAVSTDEATASESWNANVSSIVYALATDGTNLFVGGQFYTLGSETHQNVGAVSLTDGSVISAWNNLPVNGTVHSLLVDGSDLYIGGEMVCNQSRTHCGILKVDAATGVLNDDWNPAIDQAYVYSMVNNGTSIIAAGMVWHYNDVPITSAQWKPAAIWQVNKEGTGTITGWSKKSDNFIYSIAQSGSNLYLGGSFMSYGGETRNNLAAFDQTTNQVTSWNPGAVGNNGSVFALTTDGTNIYVGGDFSVPERDFAVVDPVSGSFMPTMGVTDIYYSSINKLSLSPDNTKLYIGGYFKSFASTTVDDLVAVDLPSLAVDSNWLPTLTIGQNYNSGESPVESILASDTKVYVSVYQGNVYALNPTDGSTDNSFSYTSSDMWGDSFPVDAMYLNSGTLYVGAKFGTLKALNAETGEDLNMLADNNAGGGISSFDLDGNVLYTGGSSLAAFNIVDSSDINWNPDMTVPSDYSRCTSACGNVVNTVLVGTDGVYVGGNFNTLAGKNFSYFAKLGKGDGTVYPKVNFTNNSSSVAENVDGGEVKIPVTLSIPFASNVMVDYSVTGGTAANGTDYILTSPGTLSYAPGSTSSQISLNILDNHVAGPDQTVVISLTNPSGANLGTSTSYTLYIMNSNSPGLPGVHLVQFAQTGASAAQTILLQQNIDLTLSSATSTADVTVDYAATGGTAVNGVDYVLDPGTATINRTQTEGSIYLQLKNSFITGPDKTIVITLSNPVNAILGPSSSFTFRIINNLRSDSRPDSNLWETDDTVSTTLQDNNNLFIGGLFKYVGPNNGHGVPLDLNTGHAAGIFPRIDGDQVKAAISDNSGGWYVGGKFFVKQATSVIFSLIHILSDGSLDPVFDPQFPSYLNDSQNYINALVLKDNILYIGGGFASIGGKPRQSLAAVDATTGKVESWDPSTNAYGGEIDALTIDGSTLYVGGTYYTIAGGWRNNLSSFTIPAAQPDCVVGSTPVDESFESGSTLPEGWTTSGSADWSVTASTSSDGSQSLVSGIVGPSEESDVSKEVTLQQGGELTFNWKADSANGWDYLMLCVDEQNCSLDGIFNHDAAVVANITGSVGWASVSVPLSPGTHTLTWKFVRYSDLSSDGYSDDGISSRGWIDNVKVVDYVNSACGFLDPTLDSWNPNVNGAVYAIHVNPDAIYIGGSFSYIGGYSARPRIASFDKNTRSLTAFAPPVNAPTGGMYYYGGTVNAITTIGDTVYFGGNYIYATGDSGQHATLMAASSTTGAILPWMAIAAYDRHYSSVNALATDGTTIYVGGSFSNVTDWVQRNNLAALDPITGSSTPLYFGTNGVFTDGNGTKTGGVMALALDGSGRMYAGGTFDSAGGYKRDGLAQINLTTGAVTDWDIIYNDPYLGSYNIGSIAKNGDTLYLAGDFTSLFDSIVGDPNSHSLAAVSINTGNFLPWAPEVSSGAASSVLYYNGAVYVGGNFNNIGGQPRTNLASLDPDTGLATSWNPVLTGAMNSVDGFTLDGTNLYVNGGFDTVDGQPSFGLAKFDITTGQLDTNWNPNIYGGPVYKPAISGNTIYLVGWFVTVGGQARNHVAAINKNTGALLNFYPDFSPDLYTPYSITTDGATVYIGGEDLSADGYQRSGMAAFDAVTSKPVDWDFTTRPNVYTHQEIIGPWLYTSGPFTKVQDFYSVSNFGRVPLYNPSVLLSSVQFTSAVSTTTESNATINVPISLSDAASSDVTVNYSITGGTAVSGVNYSASSTSGSIIIPAGAISTSIPITLIKDGVALPDKTIIITLSSPSGADLGANTVHTLNIIDSDSPGVSIAESDGSTNVSSVTTDTFTAVLNTQPTATTTVSVSVPDGLASTSPVSLTFTPLNWNVAQTVTVGTKATTTATSTIVFAVSSSDPVYNGVNVPDVIVYITPPIGNFFCMALNGDQPETTSPLVTVNLSTDADITKADLFNKDSSDVQKVDFNSSIENWNICPSGDCPEGLYTVYARMYTTSGDASDLLSASIIYHPQASSTNTQVGFTNTAANVLKGDTTVFAEVSLSAPTSTPVTADYSVVGGTATTGIDYVPASGQVSFAAGETATTIPLTLLNNDIAGDDKTVILGLSNPAEALLATNTQFTFTIMNNDKAGVTLIPGDSVISLSDTDKTYTYSVVLDSQPVQAVTVNTQTDGQVVNVPSAVTFSPSSWSSPQNVTVNYVDDSKPQVLGVSTVSFDVTSADTIYDKIPVDNLSVLLSNNGTATTTPTEPIAPGNGGTSSGGSSGGGTNNPPGVNPPGSGTTNPGTGSAPGGSNNPGNNGNPPGTIVPGSGTTNPGTGSAPGGSNNPGNNGNPPGTITPGTGRTQTPGSGEAGVLPVIIGLIGVVIKLVQDSSQNIISFLPGGAASATPIVATASTTAVIIVGTLFYGEPLLQTLTSITSVNDFWLMLLKALNNFLAFIGIRKKRKIWGTVYDSKTKLPLDPVIVGLVDVGTGVVAQQAITDMAGRYGFLVKPGNFTIASQKTHYAFPSKLETGATDEIYNHLYHGEVISIQSESEVLVPNIPMDPLEKDWNEQEKKRMFNRHPRLKNVMRIVFVSVFWLGFAFSFVCFAAQATPVNLGYFLFYLFLVIASFLAPAARLWGRVENFETHEYLPDVILELSYINLPAVVVAKAKTNLAGRFFLKFKKGRYLLAVKQKTSAGAVLLGTTEVEIGKEDVLNKDIII